MRAFHCPSTWNQCGQRVHDRVASLSGGRNRSAPTALAVKSAAAAPTEAAVSNTALTNMPRLRELLQSMRPHRGLAGTRAALLLEGGTTAPPAQLLPARGAHQGAPPPDNPRLRSARGGPPAALGAPHQAEQVGPAPGGLPQLGGMHGLGGLPLAAPGGGALDLPLAAPGGGALGLPLAAPGGGALGLPEAEAAPALPAGSAAMRPHRQASPSPDASGGAGGTVYPRALLREWGARSAHRLPFARPANMDVDLEAHAALLTRD